VQFGAGGAGAATAYAALSMGVGRLALCDVDRARAEELASTYAPLFPGQEVVAAGPAALDSELGAVDGVVHATPTGMKEHPGLPFDVTRLAAGAWVADIVYRPIETELLRTARSPPRARRRPDGCQPGRRQPPAHHRGASRRGADACPLP
jgi:shikimate dehydrogenase